MKQEYMQVDLFTPTPVLVSQHPRTVELQHDIWKYPVPPEIVEEIQRAIIRYGKGLYDNAQFEFKDIEVKVTR